MTRTCAHCGATFITDSKASKYCSRPCFYEDQRGKSKTRKRTPWQTRFWKYVPETLPTPDACWEWFGCTNEHGYGRLQRDGSKGGQLKAHRASYMLHVGEIPDGLVVCHRCDNPPCCNPHHLFLGTQKDNGRDMAAKGRSAAQRGHQNGRLLITDEGVRALREDAANGLCGEELSVKYGLTIGSLREIVAGRSRPKAGGPIGSAIRKTTR